MPLMKPSRYNLRTVLEVRERAKQDAGKVVAARRAELGKAEVELERCVAAVEGCRRRQREARRSMSESAAAGIDAHRLLAHRTHLADLRAQEGELIAAVERQRAVVARAERDVEAALALLTEAAKELQVIEKHREGWQQEQTRIGARRDQKLSDEIGAIIHRRRSAN